MEFSYLKITTMRPFTMKVQGVDYEGMEAIAYTPTKKKIKVTSELIFPMPLLDYDKQTTAMVENCYLQLLVEEKKCELFYNNINKKKESIDNKK
tara:strand:- start:2901 stop:3182 length:282 start_codon:yes stop_codon:yes gene_type:complete